LLWTRRASGERGTELRSLRVDGVPGGHSFQLSFDDSRAGKGAPVHFIETPIRGVEDEAAGDADGDADGAALELDRKSLRNHGLCSWRAIDAGARLRIRTAAALA